MLFYTLRNVDLEGAVVWKARRAQRAALIGCSCIYTNARTDAVGYGSQRIQSFG